MGGDAAEHFADEVADQRQMLTHQVLVVPDGVGTTTYGAHGVSGEAHRNGPFTFVDGPREDRDPPDASRGY
ncbi:hypothetical protein GCM10009539_78390 [Cryptosporangium japonicum]|uniref:Uncharacterized protein n=1 Tax=Cryptosporangium japonicum TaxID=80872 RepID=A0ABN0V824_9ACTN